MLVLAQGISLEGNVIDTDSNDPLTGATVFVKGTSNGTTTNFDGNFELNALVGDTLVISYLSMKTQELVVLSFFNIICTRDSIL